MKIIREYWPVAFFVVGYLLVLALADFLDSIGTPPRHGVAQSSFASKDAK